MSLYQTAMKNRMASYYGTTLPYLNVLTALGTSNAAGTEPSGGSPANARVASNWGSASNGAVTGAGSTVNVPSGSTVVGVGFYDGASGAPTYYDQASLTSQSFSSQGTYTITPTFTQN